MPLLVYGRGRFGPVVPRFRFKKKYNIRVVDIDCVVSGLASQCDQSVIADSSTISQS